MQLSPSLEAASHSAAQEYPDILWEPEGSLPCSQEPATSPYPVPPCAWLDKGKKVLASKV
jgi:hypothetical protein